MTEPIHVLSAIPLSEATQASIREVDDRIRLLVLSAEGRRRFRNRGGGGEEGAEEVRSAVGEAAAWLTLRFDHDWIPDHGPLRWIQLASAGADHALRQPIPEGITVTNAGSLYATPVAEWVLTFLLMHAKRMPYFLEQQREATWSRREEVANLRGATVAVVGLGAIGGEVARLCQAFGARVIGSRRSARRGDRGAHCDALYPADELPAMLRQADYVVLAVPLTEETRGSFGAAELGAMKPGSALVNIARGAVVDQEALTAALASGTPAAAYTDVMVPEPLPDGDPLWGTPNLYITPHSSGYFPNWMDGAGGVFVENLRRYVAGQPLESVVDPARGY